MKPLYIMCKINTFSISNVIIFPLFFTLWKIISLSCVFFD